MVNNDNNCEIQFWKVIRNCVLFKKILYYLLNETTYIPPLKSLLYLLENNLKNHLLHKIINNHETIFDINLNDHVHIYKLFFLFSKSNNKLQPQNYNKSIIKQFYSNIFQFTFNNGIKLNETLISNNAINTCNIVPLKEYNKLKSSKENKIINCSINNFIDSYRPRTYCQTYIIKILYYFCKISNGNSYGNDHVNNQTIINDRNIIWERIIISIDSIYSFCNLIKSKHGQITDYESSDHLSVSTYSINQKYYKSVKSSFSFATYLITTLSFLPSTETLKNQYMYQLRLLFKLCPIIHNFKIKFLYGICLTYNILQHSGGGVVEFKSMVIPKNEFDSKLSNYNLNMDTYQSRDNIQLIIKAYNKIKESLYPFSRYGDEITALKYGDFKLLKNWYISNQSTQQDRDHLDLIYHGNDINNVVSSTYTQSFYASLSNLYKYFGSVLFGISNIRKQSTNCRLTELFELNQHTSKHTLFQHCLNQDKQIHFVTQICDEIINNSNQFKLHPLLLLQILIVNDNIELIKIVINKLSNQLSNIKQCNFNVSTSLVMEQELSFYNPSLVFQNIKSYQVFHYLFKHCNFSTLNINWMKIKGLYLKEGSGPSVPEIESISELDYSFSVVGILKNQYMDIYILNERQIDHVKNIILNYKHGDVHKSTTIYYDFDQTVHNFKNLDPLLCIQLFNWLYNHFKTSNNQMILSPKNRDIFNYFVFSFNGDIDNLETHFFKSDINIVTFDQFCEKYNMNQVTYSPWVFLKYTIELSDLTILKLIIKHYFDDGIITTSLNRNLNIYINYLIEKQSSKHIKIYLLKYQSVYYNSLSINQQRCENQSLSTRMYSAM